MNVCVCVRAFFASILLRNFVHFVLKTILTNCLYLEHKRTHTHKIEMKLFSITCFFRILFFRHSFCVPIFSRLLLEEKVIAVLAHGWFALDIEQLKENTHTHILLIYNVNLMILRSRSISLWFFFAVIHTCSSWLDEQLIFSSQWGIHSESFIWIQLRNDFSGQLSHSFKWMRI